MSDTENITVAVDEDTTYIENIPIEIAHMDSIVEYEEEQRIQEQEQQRIQKELIAQEQEQQRIQEEQQRIQEEQQRIQEEQQRIQEEQQRIQEEQQRIQEQEQQRIQEELIAQEQEEQRIQEELIAQEQEEQRIQEELIAQEQEQQRIQEELIAQEQEQQRIQEEEQRIQEELIAQEKEEERIQEELIAQEHEEQRIQEELIAQEQYRMQEATESSTSLQIPKIIFIVPYRDREQQLRFFSLHMQNIMSDYDINDYKIIYAHQDDKRDFNRGAMKNIGFLYAKQLYPNDYQSITFVFNDIDTMPYSKNFLNYETVQGSVKHFYGYTFTLGGIVSIKGADFERVNGFPNYWAWGYEDNAFNDRVKKSGLTIDRNQFYPIMDKNILQMKDGITRTVNRKEFDRYIDEVKYNGIIDGLNTISNIVSLYDQQTSFLNISHFLTPVENKPEFNQIHDMRNGATPFRRLGNQRRGRPIMGMIF